MANITALELPVLLAQPDRNALGVPRLLPVQRLRSMTAQETSPQLPSFRWQVTALATTYPTDIPHPVVF